MALPNSYPVHRSAGKDTEEQKGSFYLGSSCYMRDALLHLDPSARFKFDDVSILLCVILEQRVLFKTDAAKLI